MANLRLWTGRLADAEQLAERAQAGFRELNDRYGLMQALGPLNRARAGLGKKADAKRGVEESIALGKAFGELGLALQAAAGVAMHLGYGEQVLTLAEQIIERNRETGTNADEAYVLLALAHCQLGDVDEAMAAIEEVDVDDFPFGLGARALVRAVAGEHAARDWPTPRRSSRCVGRATSTSPSAGSAACWRHSAATTRDAEAALARALRHAGRLGRRRRVPRRRPAPPRPARRRGHDGGRRPRPRLAPHRRLRGRRLTPHPSV